MAKNVRQKVGFWCVASNDFCVFLEVRKTSKKKANIK